MAAPANPLPKGDAVVDKVTGAIVETPELRAEGLAQLRAAMKVSARARSRRRAARVALVRPAPT